MQSRREAMLSKGKDAYKPRDRERIISKSLKAYAQLVSSADSGAIRVIE